MGRGAEVCLLLMFIWTMAWAALFRPDELPRVAGAAWLVIITMIAVDVAAQLRGIREELRELRNLRRQQHDWREGRRV